MILALRLFVYPSATSLAVLSIEEAGKVLILRELSVANDGKDIKEIWQRYRHHRSKNAAWILPDLVSNGARHLYQLAEAVNPDGEHTELLDTIKQLGFYTDFFEDGHCSIPSEVIEVDLASSLIKTAKLLSGGKEVTEREIELWIQHMKPV